MREPSPPTSMRPWLTDGPMPMLLLLLLMLLLLSLALTRALEALEGGGACLLSLVGSASGSGFQPKPRVACSIPVAPSLTSSSTARCAASLPSRPSRPLPLPSLPLPPLLLLLLLLLLPLRPLPSPVPSCWPTMDSSRERMRGCASVVLSRRCT